ncbi:MAG: hypothetical protein ABI184_03905, partial [Ginsengibacter sp.]
MMERRFDMSDFEQSLKDHADQFTLIPSRRVWNGIYNNLHPGSKWPSITVAIVFIITLFTIGFLNNSSKKVSSEADSVPSTKSIDNNYLRHGNSIASATNSVLADKTNAEKNTSFEKNNSGSFINNNGTVQKSENEKLSTSTNTKLNKTPGQNRDQAFSSKGKNNSSNIEKPISGNKIATATNNSISYEITNLGIIGEEGNNEISTENYNSFMTPGQYQINEFLPTEPDYINYSEGYALIKNNEDFSSSAQLTASSRLETHIRPLKKTINQSKKIHRKKNKNIDWTYYVTPTISAPIFRNSSLASSVNFSPLAIFQNAAANGMIY